MKEVGYPDVGTVAWNGMFAPAATPRPVLEALHRAAVAALNSDGGKAALTEQELHHRAIEVARRRAHLARGPDRRLEEDHRPR